MTEHSFLNASTLESLKDIVNQSWFYYLDLAGTAAFAISGMLRAYHHRYDFFGTFLLASLPAVGGGTMRDLLVGGERHPPFIFNDPTYLYIVLVVVIGGICTSGYFMKLPEKEKQFMSVLNFFDTIGLAVFTIIGAKVAIVADLHWFWIPILSAMTCTGGGILMDIVTAKESDVLKGEIYEELAGIGGLSLLGCLFLANRLENPQTFLIGAIVTILLSVFILRWIVIRRGFRSPVLGN